MSRARWLRAAAAVEQCRDRVAGAEQVAAKIHGQGAIDNLERDLERVTVCEYRFEDRRIDVDAVETAVAAPMPLPAPAMMYDLLTGATPRTVKGRETEQHPQYGSSTCTTGCVDRPAVASIIPTSPCRTRLAHPAPECSTDFRRNPLIHLACRA